MTGKVTNTGELNWLLDDLTTRVGAVRQAVILSTDGLAVGFSKGLSREDAEHLSAVAAGFQSLAPFRRRRGAPDDRGDGVGVPVRHGRRAGNLPGRAEQFRRRRRSHRLR